MNDENPYRAPQTFCRPAASWAHKLAVGVTVGSILCLHVTVPVMAVGAFFRWTGLVDGCLLGTLSLLVVIIIAGNLSLRLRPYAEQGKETAQ